MNDLDSIEIKPFNYQSVDNDTAQYLKEKEINIITIANNTYTAVGRELKDAQDKLAQNGYGCFEEWYTSLGYKKTSVYRLIGRFELIERSTMEQSNLLESLPVNLTYEISKPSANPELKQAVLDGDIKTYKEYKELEREKKEAERRAQQAEAEKQELEEARWQDISTINEMSKKIEELEARKPEVIEKIVEKEVVPQDYYKLKSEVNETKEKLYKAEVEMGEIAAAHVATKNKHAARSSITRFMQDVNKGMAELELKMQDPATKEDELINAYLDKVTEMLDECIDKIENYKMDKGGFVNAKYTID